MLEFVIITGLKCTYDIDDYMYTSSSKSALMSKYFPDAKGGITRSKLITRVIMQNFDNSEDALNLVILFFVHTFLFSQHKEAPISLAYFQMVENDRSVDEFQLRVGIVTEEFADFSTIPPRKILIKEDIPAVMDDEKSTRARLVRHVYGLYSEMQKDTTHKREFGVSEFENRHQREIGVSPERDQLKSVPSSSTEPKGTSKLSLDSNEIKNYINKCDYVIFVSAYEEILSEGKQVHSCGFDAESQRGRYASLLWHYGVTKAKEGHTNDNGDPPRPTPRALIHKPVADTNNIKKCNQRLLEKATPKIWDQKRLAVTIE
ncbi:ORF57g [Capsicum annuum]|nr:ORF57g [Capsicum annuum]